MLGAALRLLSYRQRSEAELSRRLLKRFLPERVEVAMTILKARGLLDDATFANFWRENRERHRPKAAIAIKQELLRLGVKREVVEEAIQGLDEEDNAYRAAVRLLPRLKSVDYQAFRSRVGPYLQRRGFSYQVIAQTLKRLWQELSDTAPGQKDTSQ